MEKKVRMTESELHNLISETVKRVLKEEEFDDMGLQRRAAYNSMMQRGGDDTPDTLDPEGTRGVRHSFDFAVPGDEFYHMMEIKSTKDFSWQQLNDVLKVLFGEGAKISGGMANSSFYFNGYDLDSEGKYLPDGSKRRAMVRGRMENI
jgi:hypothetical protein